MTMTPWDRYARPLPGTHIIDPAAADLTKGEAGEGEAGEGGGPLTPVLGRAAAHAQVEQVARSALARNIPFGMVLAEQPTVSNLVNSSSTASWTWAVFSHVPIGMVVISRR